MIRLPLIFLLFLCLSCNNVNPTSALHTFTDKQISDEQIIKNVDSIFNTIDYTIINIYEHYYSKYSDSEIITASLFVEKKIIKKLTFDFINIRPNDTVDIFYYNTPLIYYFDDAGGLIGRKENSSPGSKTYAGEAYVNNHTLFFYRDSMNGLKKEEYSDDTSFFYKANIEWYLCSFLFNKKYRVKSIRKYFEPALEAIDSIKLYSSPSKTSREIKLLYPGTKLVFLDVSENPDTVTQRVWHWYKVQTEDSEIGWVFGYPKFVSVLYEHDCPD